VKAVDGLTVSVAPGQTLGIVGESGSGKSVTSLTVMRLLPEFTARIPTGKISFMGRDLLATGATGPGQRGRDIAMIFQEPMTSLNPVYRVGDQVAEAIILHQKVSRKQAWKRTIELFDEVGIPDPRERVRSYPHEMSGGQKQRVMIAMALSCNPKLLIADEPTTALDVTIQKQILDLLRGLRDRRGMAMLFITHDLGVIAEIADHVAVMYRGKLVEHGDVVSVFENPTHPYTRGLLACRPRLDTRYRILPTVSDFLETWEEDGEIQIREKELTAERIEELEQGGRAKMPEGTGDPVLTVRDLKVWFPLPGAAFGATRYIKAVDGIDFDVFRGQTLGLVGESGCGKTTTGRAILHLVEPTAGTITFEGKNVSFLGKQRSAGTLGGPIVADIDVVGATLNWGAAAVAVAVGVAAGMSTSSILTGLSVGAVLVAGVAGFLAWRGSKLSPEVREVRRRLQIIFQDPYSSLNPRFTVEQTLTEPMLVHGIGSSHSDRVKRAGDLLEEVGLPRIYLRRYPHEFSGGQRQRICIARTLALEPSLIICDESVSALDVSVQAQVLNLLKELQLSRGLTYIFISHDLSVVKFMSDVMAVMQDGKIVEIGPAEAIYANPAEQYTRDLIAAIPRDDLPSIRSHQDDRLHAGGQRVEGTMEAEVDRADINDWTGIESEFAQRALTAAVVASVFPPAVLLVPVFAVLGLKDVAAHAGLGGRSKVAMAAGVVLVDVAVWALVAYLGSVVIG
jgi:peptide/nickel transport system ATP-binding protein